MNFTPCGKSTASKYTIISSQEARSRALSPTAADVV